MKIIIVSHPDRAHHVAKLVDHLDVAATVIDSTSALHGHRTALKLAAKHDERVTIMEDDAIPVADFNSLATAWTSRHPNDLISFYLGTFKPRDLQPLITHKINESRRIGRDAIWLAPLIHGVCYSIPPSHLQRIIAYIERPSRVREADFLIGMAWGREVCYPIESLVQHRDEAPVEKHPDGQPRIMARVARHLAGPLMFNP